MPPGFTFPHDGLDAWLPLRWNPANRTAVWFRRAHWIRPIARLEPGITFEQANAELQVVVKRLQQQYPETNRVMGAGMTPLHEFLVGDTSGRLLILLGAVGLLLLLTCANVANLTLVRAAARQNELAVRTALGASRAHIMRTVLSESLLLSVAGGLGGLLVAVGGLGLLRRLEPDGVRQLGDVALDARVLVYALVLTLAAGLLFGLLPASRSARSGPGETLKQGTRGGTLSRRGARSSQLLVAFEMALAVMLVLGAGLLVRSFVALRQVDPGFQYDQRLTATLGLPVASYPDNISISAFFDGLVARLESAPGVEAVTLTTVVPLARTSYTSDYIAEGRPPDGYGAEVMHRSVAPNYFDVMGVPILAGRPLEASDRADSEPVVVINEVLARQYFPNEDPIGQRITFDRVPTAESIWRRIVGVAGTELQDGVGLPARPEVYKPLAQAPSTFVSVVLHARGEPLALLPMLQNAVRALDADLPLREVETYEEIYRRSLSRDRFLLLLLGTFAVVALLLATVGIYGVASQATRRRTQEIGVRVALGARSGDVIALILRQGAVVAVCGIMAGVLVALVGGRVLRSVLFGVAANDFMTFLAVPALLALAALLASLIPAWRASRIDPVRALRAE